MFYVSKYSFSHRRIIVNESSLIVTNLVINATVLPFSRGKKMDHVEVQDLKGCLIAGKYNSLKRQGRIRSELDEHHHNTSSFSAPC